MTGYTYTVTLNGTSAIVRRHTMETYRRWFRTRTRDVSLVVGVYPCRMSLDLRHILNRPSELDLTLESYSTTLRGKI